MVDYLYKELPEKLALEGKSTNNHTETLSLVFYKNPQKIGNCGSSSAKGLILAGYMLLAQKNLTRETFKNIAAVQKQYKTFTQNLRKVSLGLVGNLAPAYIPVMQNSSFLEEIRKKHTKPKKVKIIATVSQTN